MNINVVKYVWTIDHRQEKKWNNNSQKKSEMLFLKDNSSKTTRERWFPIKWFSTIFLHYWLSFCNSLIDGSFKLGRRKKMEPFSARWKVISAFGRIVSFFSPAPTFHLQDNKYPKSNFSPVFYSQQQKHHFLPSSAIKLYIVFFPNPFSNDLYVSAQLGRFPSRVWFQANVKY